MRSEEGGKEKGEVGQNLEEEDILAKEVKETQLGKKEVVTEDVAQLEKDSAVLEDVELPTKDDPVVEAPVESLTKDEPVPEPSTNLPTNEVTIETKEEASVLEDVELPTTEEAISEPPPTNLPTSEDPIETMEEAAVLEKIESTTREEATTEPSVNLPTNENQGVTKGESAISEDVKIPTEEEALPEPPQNLPTNEHPTEMKESVVRKKISASKNKSVLTQYLHKKQTPVMTEKFPSTDGTTELTTIEPSKKGEIVFERKMLDISKYGKQYWNEEDTEDDFDITPEGFALLQDWQKEIGLSLEKLKYYVETYPGIDTGLIEAVEKGEMSEEQMFTLLEEIQAEDEEDLTPEVQEKLKIFAKHFHDIGDSLFEDPAQEPVYTDLDLKQLGLRRSDIAALADGTAELTTPQTIRIGRALRKAGVGEEAYKELMDSEELEKEQLEFEKEFGVEDAPDEEIPMPTPEIRVYNQVTQEVEEMQKRTGISEERVTHYYTKFNGNISAELIEAAEKKLVTEERMAYYIEKYAGNTYPLPLDSALIIAMDKGEIQEQAYAHVLESLNQNPPPLLVKAVFKGDITTDEINELGEKYSVSLPVIASLHAKEITEIQLQNFVQEYPGVEPDARLINDIEDGVYDKDHLAGLKESGEVYPNVMSGSNFRALMNGEITEEDIERAEMEAGQEDPWDIPKEALKAWKAEYGISDEMIEVLREAYPGIWPDLVTAYARKEIEEADIPKLINSDKPWQMSQGMMERWLKANEVSEEQMMGLREKYPKIWPTLLADVVRGEVPEADIGRIVAEDEIEEEKAIQSDPWKAAGITEDNLEEWQSMNSVTDDMLTYLLDTYPDITPEIMGDFAEGLIKQKDIPDAIRKHQQRQGKTGTKVEDESKKAQLDVEDAQARSKKVRPKSTEDAQLESSIDSKDDHIARAVLQTSQQLETPSNVQGETMAERLAWYEKRFPGISIETVSLAEMGIYPEAAIPAVMRENGPSQLNQEIMRAEMLRLTPADLKKMGAVMAKGMVGENGNAPEKEEEKTDTKTSAFGFNKFDVNDKDGFNAMAERELDLMRAKAKLPGAPRLSSITSPLELENLGIVEFYQMMLAEGIDPTRMDEEKVFRLLEKTFATKNYSHTDDEGNTVNYITPTSKQQLREINAESGESMDLTDSAAELGAGAHEGGASRRIMKGLDEYMGALSKDEITENKKERVEEGFFNYGEDNPKDVGEDEEFQGDDISSQGHEELEQHRELREYARLAAWEMPLLHSMLASLFWRTTYANKHY